MDLPIYCVDVDDFRWWQDTAGNKLDIRQLDNDYLDDMINFLRRVVIDDTECNRDTCYGFIESMTNVLDSRK